MENERRLHISHGQGGSAKQRPHEGTHHSQSESSREGWGWEPVPTLTARAWGEFLPQWVLSSPSGCACGGCHSAVQAIVGVGESAEQVESHTEHCEPWNDAATLENGPEKVWHGVSRWPSKLTLEKLNLCRYKKEYLHIYVAALFLVAKKWK